MLQISYIYRQTPLLQSSTDTEQILAQMTQARDEGTSSEICDLLILLGIRQKCLNNGRNLQGADKSLARPTSHCILFDGENILFDASLVIYINSTNILQIMIINRIYGHQNLLPL